MEHASFIIGSWVLTFVSVGAYALYVIRRGRELSRNATSEEMPWT
jgi:hypothetical protein